MGTVVGTVVGTGDRNSFLWKRLMGTVAMSYLRPQDVVKQSKDKYLHQQHYTYYDDELRIQESSIFIRTTVPI